MLPAAWVDALFAKLSLTYGRDFTARWAGLADADVKADWARELAHYADKPEAIKHALTLLPADRPPTVLQFRDLCRSAPAPAVHALPTPRMEPSPGALRVLREAHGALQAGRRHPRAWAVMLRDREAAGERLSALQRRMWRGALGLPEGCDITEAADHVAVSAAQAVVSRVMGGAA